MDIVQILQVGLPGFAFLLAWLGYRLLSRNRDQLTPSLIRAAERYFLACIGLVVLVGVFAALGAYQTRTSPEEALKPCRASLTRLSAYATRPNADLPAVIEAHVATCEEGMLNAHIP